MVQVSGMVTGGQVMVVVGVTPGSNPLRPRAQLCKSYAASTVGVQGSATVLPVKLQSVVAVAIPFSVLVLSVMVVLVMVIGEGAAPADQ